MRVWSSPASRSLGITIARYSALDRHVVVKKRRHLHNATPHPVEEHVSGGTPGPRNAKQPCLGVYLVVYGSLKWVLAEVLQRGHDEFLVNRDLTGSEGLFGPVAHAQCPAAHQAGTGD